MANETVIVGCKLPWGLLLQVKDASGKEVEVRVNGKAQYRLPNPDRKTKNTEIVYSDGLTVVPKDVWEAWLKEHKTYGPVVKGFIYASSNRPEANARAKDTESMKCIDPIDPKAPGFGLKPGDGK